MTGHTVTPAPTVDLDVVRRRVDRLARDGVRATAVAGGQFNAPQTYLRRILARLLEDRAMLSGHAALIANQIAAAPFAQQEQLIADRLRPLTLAVERASVAVARLQHAID